jgi:hypothetical protein
MVPLTRLIIRTITRSATFARPSDTNAYALGDEVSNSTSQGSAAPLAFDAVTESPGGSGYLVKATLTTDNHVVTNGQFTLYLFDSIPTMVGDNAAWPIADADLDNYVGSYDFVLRASGGAGGAVAVSAGDPIPFACAAADDALYGVLVAQGAYSPASGQAFTVRLMVEQV